MRIYLIGMPGCGKSKTAKEVASRTNYRLIDLDQKIENAYGSITEIFAKEGEEAFRKYETECLKSISNVKDAIVSCGGGIITKKENKKYMANGVVVFLNASIDTLKEHLEHSEKRPLLQKFSIEELYNRRIDSYIDFADYIIDYESYIVSANKIVSLIKDAPKLKRVLVINGPNINMLGLRDPKHYGALTLGAINSLISEYKYFKFDFYQSNHEGDIVDKIQTYKNYAGIIINPAAYTHTSVAIHDALEIVDIPKVEVHLSEVNNREDFRKVNYITDVVDKTFSGKKEQSYLDALCYLKTKLNVL